MKSYQVISPIWFKRVKYPVHSTIALTESEAKRLLEMGVITHANVDRTPPETPPADNPPAEPPADAPPAGTSDADNAVITRIVELFTEWQGDGDKLDKKPNVDDVRDALDDKAITVDQRDSAWETYIAEGE